MEKNLDWSLARIANANSEEIVEDYVNVKSAREKKQDRNLNKKKLIRVGIIAGTISIMGTVGYGAHILNTGRRINTQNIKASGCTRELEENLSFRTDSEAGVVMQNTKTKKQVSTDYQISQLKKAIIEEGYSDLAAALYAKDQFGADMDGYSIIEVASYEFETCLNGEVNRKGVSR